MSNQYENCSFCGKITQVSATADTDFGFARLGNKLICYECRKNICEDLK